MKCESVGMASWEPIDSFTNRGPVVERLKCRYSQGRVKCRNVLSLACALSSEKWAVQCGNEVFPQITKMVEAGGVEPPSEKRYDTKPTCLAQFRCFRPPRSE